jgi:hypothetical protein
MCFKKFSALAYTLLLMMFISAASLNVFAENLKPEKFEAQGSGYLIDSVLYADLYLNWMYSDSVDGFNVYISYSKTDDYNDFELLQTIAKTDDSLMQSKDYFWFVYLPNIYINNQEIISLYITAFKGGQTSDPSNISVCNLNYRQQWHSLEFTTTPPATAKLNDEYSYKFDVKTDLENPTYEFELNSIPDGPNMPPGAKLDQETKTITFTPSEGGIYYFYLTGRAEDTDGNVAESQQYWEVRVIECDKPSTISGTVKNEDGENILWCYATIYMVSDKGNDSTGWGNIQYVAQMAFENGEYSFTGPDKGKYIIQVYGYNGKNNMEYYPEWFDNAKKMEDATPIELNCDEAANANFILEKVPVPNYYTVSGYVKDAETKQSIEYAEVDFMSEDPVYGYFNYAAITNSFGYYEVSLPDGFEYTAVAYVNFKIKDSINFPGLSTYLPQYWDGKTDPEEADKIVLSGNLDNINFNLEKLPEPNYYIVTGLVYDAKEKLPIEYAEVNFMGVDSLYGQYVSYSVSTNEDGIYSIALPEGVSYTAVAFAGRYKIDSNHTYQDMYMPQYWNGKTDPAEADKIELTGDLNNINFNLNKLDIYENFVNGFVKNEDGDALQNVLLIAYIIDGSEDVNNMYRGYLAITDNNGYFEMKNLYPAEYVLLAVPAMNITYAPGFYKENDFATLTWEDATKITVGNDGTYGAYNVKLQLFEKVIGEGIVKGIVRAETGRVKSSAEFQGKDGLQGVQVHIVDMLGNRIKSTETDKSGYYEFSGLAKGTYNVVIDKIGYKSDNFNVTIDDDTKLIDRTVTLVPAGTTAVEDNTFLLNGICVFPNPASDLFSVKFNGDGNYAKLKLFDAQGNIVYTNVISTNTGENNYNINTLNLTSGTYFIRIEMNNSGIFTPVIISK